MTYDEVKTLLRSVRSKKSRLKALQSYIAEERALMIGVTGQSYDSLGVVSSQCNGTEERYAKRLDRLNQLQERFDNLFDEMCKEEENLAELMQRLSATEYEVILNRYMRGISVRKTAQVMMYEESTIKYHTHNAILRMM